jgi:hypothetical protein
LFFNQMIGFGCTCVRNNFLTKGNQNYNLVVMVHLHVLERINDNTYKIDLAGEYMVLVLPLLLLILLCLTRF